MGRKATKPTASWTDVKACLSELDRVGLLGLVHDLYSSSRENQAFLHARFNVGDDVLEPYKAIIDRWLWPDSFKSQDISIGKAKKAITEYKKAIGNPVGMSELAVFYCERAAGFSADVCLQDETYFGALIGMFEQALHAIHALPEVQQPALFARLATVRLIAHDFGYGVGDELDDLLTRFGPEDDESE